MGVVIGAGKWTRMWTRVAVASAGHCFEGSAVLIMDYVVLAWLLRCWFSIYTTLVGSSLVREKERSKGKKEDRLGGYSRSRRFQWRTD